jgi:hypothetical protein
LRRFSVFGHLSPAEVVQLFDAAFRQIYTRRTSPETKFEERSSDAVQAYARVRAEHRKRHALPSPEFSLNARIPTLPNCVEVVQFFDAAFRQISTWRTSPETKFGERSSDAVQAYARVRAEHGKRRALPSPTAFSRVIPTLQARHFKNARPQLRER